MKRTAIAAAIGGVLLIGACVSMSGSEAVSTLPADIAANARVEEIRLTRGDIKVGEGFDELFRTRVKAKLDACAKGSRALRLDASIHKYERTNPVITTIIAGRNVIRGEARLTDIATGKEVAVYQIGHTVVGGKLGILAMGQAEQQLSDAFGTELCNQAFATAK